MKNPLLQLMLCILLVKIALTQEPIIQSAFFEFKASDEPISQPISGHRSHIIYVPFPKPFSTPPSKHMVTVYGFQLEGTVIRFGARTVNCTQTYAVVEITAGDQCGVEILQGTVIATSSRKYFWSFLY